MNNEELKRLQKTELEILDCFVDICQKKKLRYYLNAGTLLGAVRHHGFIPWDDDIDVCMPRSDYELFLKTVDSLLPDNMRAVHFRIQGKEEHLQYSCQIMNLDFPLIQTIAQVPRKTYVWIDVFPLDGMPNNKLRRRLHGFHLLFRRAMMQLSMFDQNVNISKTGRPAYERVIISICKRTGIGKRLNTYRQMEKLDQALKKYPDTANDLWVNFMGAYKLKETFPVTYYAQGTEYEFEQRKLLAPEKADKILTNLYGDYMVPRKPTNATDGHQLSIL